MLSIYQKDIVEKICKEYCDGVEENGKTIKTGMIFWVKKRVDKFCISRNIEVKKLKSELSIIKIKEILEAKYFEQIDIWNEFKSYEELKNKPKDSKTILQNIFDYEAFRAHKSKIINGYWLAEELGIDCCPYCNRNYTMSHKHKYDLAKKENKYVFPSFDHFYPKEKYPLLALSFYNLIPCCTLCNSDYKGSKDPNDINEPDYNIFHPYTEFENNHFSFDFIPEKYEDLVGKSKKIDLKINYKNNLINTDLEKSIKFFGILENYSNHRDMIQDIIDKKITFSDRYLSIIQSTYGLDFQTTYKMLFGTHYDDDKLSKLPFSKLKKDIYDKLEEARKK